MNKDILDIINKKSGMKAPDGYFESLNERIMQNLPKKEITEEYNPPITFWTMAKPWVYMAAMFAGIALMFKVFTWTGGDFVNSNTEAKAVETETESIEDFIFYNNVSDYAIYEFLAEGD